jgi:hypothetical protein
VIRVEGEVVLRVPDMFRIVYEEAYYGRLQVF